MSTRNNIAGTNANVTLTQQQLTELINNVVAQVTATREGNARNNNAPDYIIPPEQKEVGSVYRVIPLGKWFEKITEAKWKELDGTILGLTNGDVHALCDEDITYPHDYAMLDADTLDAVLEHHGNLQYAVFGSPFSPYSKNCEVHLSFFLIEPRWPRQKKKLQKMIARKPSWLVFLLLAKSLSTKMWTRFCGYPQKCGCVFVVDHKNVDRNASPLIGVSTSTPGTGYQYLYLFLVPVLVDKVQVTLM